MQVVEGRVLISPSDITSAAACEFAWLRGLDLRLGRIEQLPNESDPLIARATDLGLLHEERQLRAYEAQFGIDGVATIESPGGDLSALAEACTETLTALRSCKPVVYQAAVQDRNLRGFADFIVLSSDGEYVVQDTKLARTAKVSALLQIAAYADILASQGIPIANEGTLILGDGSAAVHDLGTVIPVYRARRATLEDMLSRHLDTGDAVAWGDPSVSACGRCPVCVETVETSSDVLLVAGMRRTQRDRLWAADIRTIDDLASATDVVPGLPEGNLDRLRLQAHLQIRGEVESQLPFTVIETAALSALPAPSQGDIFFDFEGDPMWQDPSDRTWGLEYLFGVIEADTGDFVHFWADDREEEREALGAFLDYVSERRRRWPDMHIYHYADYERAALLRLAGEFGEGEDQVDDLLRAGVLVDLYPIVRGSIMVGSSSYGLKALEPLFLPEKRQGDVTTAGDSVVQYAAYCLEREQDNVEAASEVKKDILDYNEQDCRSTLLLRDWLLTRLTEQPTPVPAVRPDSTTAGVRAEEEAAVAEPLWQMAGVDARTPEQQGFALLAAAVGFHRREEKPFWWGHFDRLDNPPETWADARDALLIEECTVTQDWTKTGRANPRRYLRVRGPLQPGSCLERDGKAYLLYDQPHPVGLPNGGSASRGHSNAEITLISHDGDSAVFDIVETLPRGCDPFLDLPMAAAPVPGPGTQPLRQAISDIAQETARTRFLPAPIANLLLREGPTLTGPMPQVVDDDFTAAITRAVLTLESSTLAVQGPPGSGKTHTASHVIANLVDTHHWRVGVVSQGHNAVNHLLDYVVKAGVDPSLIGKKDKPEESTWTNVPTKDTAAFLVDHQNSGCVYGGTAWDFANANRVEQGLFDLLVIDEAGQFSLANTIAVSRSAQRMLLLGDPQQLPQVSQGTHPEPVDQSALNWLTQEAVLPAEFGYFLRTTWRMHPDLCRAVSEHSYGGRLTAHPCTNERAMTDTHGHRVATGVAVESLDHHGNSVASAEEAATVAALTGEALTWQWQETPDKPARPMTPDDVLIVAPYNAQVDLIRKTLDSTGLTGFRVGTVDKFQGQQAPVVIVSMTASSHDDVPRGMEFLLSPNRVNVAVSRAQWRTVIVQSTRLTDYLPSRPERLHELGRHMRLTTYGQPTSDLGRSMQIATDGA